MSEPSPAERLVLRRDAVTAGWSDDELARLVRSNDWSRVRRGAYLDGIPPEGAVERHRLLVAATVAALRRDAVVSHQSAAVLLGFPMWGVPLGRVHVTRKPPACHDSGRLLVAHVSRLRDDEVTTAAGLRVTSPVRTALDLARSMPFDVAVVTLDAALRVGLVRQEELAARVSDIAGTRGSRAAARAVPFADGRSESVGESRSRVVLHRLGLPPPALQLSVHAPDGRFVARTDFAWERERVVGEFDGRAKYGRLLRVGQDAGDAVFDEKRREDDLRDQGWSVVRWTWDELSRPGGWAQRLRRALARHAV